MIRRFFIFSTSGCVVVVKMENKYTAMYILTNYKISYLCHLIQNIFVISQWMSSVDLSIINSAVFSVA